MTAPSSRPLWRKLAWTLALGLAGLIAMGLPGIWLFIVGGLFDLLALQTAVIRSGTYPEQRAAKEGRGSVDLLTDLAVRAGAERGYEFNAVGSPRLRLLMMYSVCVPPAYIVLASTIAWLAPGISGYGGPADLAPKLLFGVVPSIRGFWEPLSAAGMPGLANLSAHLTAVSFVMAVVLLLIEGTHMPQAIRHATAQLPSWVTPSARWWMFPTILAFAALIFGLAMLFFGFFGAPVKRLDVPVLFVIILGSGMFLPFGSTILLMGLVMLTGTAFCKCRPDTHSEDP